MKSNRRSLETTYPSMAGANFPAYSLACSPADQSLLENTTHTSVGTKISPLICKQTQCQGNTSDVPYLCKRNVSVGTPVHPGYLDHHFLSILCHRRKLP